MKRREFLGCAALTSVGALTGKAITEPIGKKENFRGCKITVLKRLLFQDLNEKYYKRKGQICDAFKDGQEFTCTSAYRPPEGFCQWAWADIRSSILAAYNGSPGPSIVCCTDGARPVIFLVEPA